MMMNNFVNEFDSLGFRLVRFVCRFLDNSPFLISRILAFFFPVFLAKGLLCVFFSIGTARYTGP